MKDNISSDPQYDDQPEIAEAVEPEFPQDRPKAQSITPADWEAMKLLTRQDTVRPDDVTGTIEHDPAIHHIG